MVLAPQSKYHHQGTPRSGAMAYHVAAIPTPAVCGDSSCGAVRWFTWSGPRPDLCCSTTVVLFSSRVPSPSLVLSLPALTAVRVLSLPDYRLGDPGSGDKQIHISQCWVLPCPRVLTSPLDHRFSSLYLILVAQHTGEIPCCLTTHVLFEGANEAAKFVS